MFQPYIRHDGFSVEAVQVTSANAEAIARKFGFLLIEEIHPETNERMPGLNVVTSSGNLRASSFDGDYIVQGINGATVMKAIEFETDYTGI